MCTEEEVFKKWNDKMTEIDGHIEIALEKLKELHVEPDTLQNSDFGSNEVGDTFEQVHEALLNLLKLRCDQYDLHVSMRNYKIKKALASLRDSLPTNEDEEPDEN